jgi:hypothetical protein
LRSLSRRSQGALRNDILAALHLQKLCFFGLFAKSSIFSKNITFGKSSKKIELFKLSVDKTQKFHFFTKVLLFYDILKFRKKNNVFKHFYVFFESFGKNNKNTKTTIKTQKNINRQL